MVGGGRIWLEMAGNDLEVLMRWLEKFKNGGEAEVVGKWFEMVGKDQNGRKWSEMVRRRS